MPSVSRLPADVRAELAAGRGLLRAADFEGPGRSRSRLHRLERKGDLVVVAKGVYADVAALAAADPGPPSGCAPGPSCWRRAEHLRGGLVVGGAARTAHDGPTTPRCPPSSDPVRGSAGRTGPATAAPDSPRCPIAGSGGPTGRRRRGLRRGRPRPARRGDDQARARRCRGVPAGRSGTAGRRPGRYRSLDRVRPGGLVGPALRPRRRVTPGIGRAVRVPARRIAAEPEQRVGR
ncbi:MAG: type IV toxin-antitoxin system AbiEi family antitoxin domain-containing protein [Nakamurella multipartita]